MIVGIPAHIDPGAYASETSSSGHSWTPEEGGGLTLGHQTIHHALYELDLILQTKIDEIRIHQHPVRRPERLIMAQEQASRQGVDPFLFLLFLFDFDLFRRLFHVFLETWVRGLDHAFDGGELAGGLCFALRGSGSRVEGRVRSVVRGQLSTRWSCLP